MRLWPRAVGPDREGAPEPDETEPQPRQDGDKRPVCPRVSTWRPLVASRPGGLRLRARRPGSPENARGETTKRGDI